MTADGLLTLALDAAFLLVFGSVLLGYVRQPDQLRLSLVAVFGSVVVVFLVQLAGTLLPLPPVLSSLALLALLAQPLLTLRLIHLFRPLPRVWLLVAFLLYVAAAGGLLLGGVSNRLILIPAAAYFVGTELLASALLWQEARRRAGASRVRLGIAAAATAMFGAGVLVAVTGAALRGTGDVSGGYVLARVLALAAGIGYLAAFAPPPWLRTFTHRGVVFDFIRRLGQFPTGTPPAEIWGLLAAAAREVTGGVSARVRLDDGAGVAAVVGTWEGDVTGAGLLNVPVATDTEPTGVLEVRLTGRPLFVEDDVDLLRLLGNRAARAAEREQVLMDLKRASEAKSEFLAAMSHELRTPLNAIIGFSELLLQPPSDAAYDAATIDQYAGHIHSAGLHLLDLINDVLDLAKVEAGKLDLRLTRFDVAALMRQTVETMRPLADRKAQVLELDAPGELELEADAGRVRQVVFNLLSNAIKFTPEGGRITADLSRENGHVRLSVTDTGPGIAPADQSRVFEAFQQLDGVGTRQKGTGLGLALTRQLVTHHGGRIELQSAVGSGSRFTVSLPARAPDEREPVQEVQPITDEAEGPLLLIIEDDPGAAELLRVYLAEDGFRVLIVPGGERGLEEARTRSPAAIVLDILLPDIDGWEVLQRLKQDQATRDIPVLVVSVVDDAQLGLALGAVDYFVKPVGRDSLLRALGKLTFTTKVRHRRVSVLAIDADPRAVARYRAILEPDGFEVASADAALPGMELARASVPDLILLDLSLPDLDGFELVTRLQDDPRTRDIPIWVTTDGLTPQEKERLNGRVLGVAQRGDPAVSALRAWLGRMASSGVSKA